MAERLTPIPIALGTGTEEERGFFKSRLRLFTGYLFLISGSFYVIDMAISVPALGAALILLWVPKLLHLAATLLTGALWFALRQREFLAPAPPV